MPPLRTATVSTTVQSLTKKDLGTANAERSILVSKPKDWGKKADQSKAPAATAAVKK